MAAPLLNKTISRSDLSRPEVAAAARQLRRLAVWLWLRRIRYAVNGVLKSRWRIRWNKLWEYARGLAYADFQPGQRVLDFGGAATVPVFYLARLGCEVLSLDIDAKLTDHTNAVAANQRWRLSGSTFDLTRNEAPANWGQFDRVISYCVLEHIPGELQPRTIDRLGGLLKPGGLFALTFDFGDRAPVEGALRSVAEVERLIAGSQLEPLGNPAFCDTGERFPLDNRYRDRQFTFGSLFLRK